MYDEDGNEVESMKTTLRRLKKFKPTSVQGLQRLALVIQGGDELEQRNAVRQLHAILHHNEMLSPLAVEQGCIAPLQALAVNSKLRVLQSDVLKTLALLALCFQGARVMASDAFLLELMFMCIGKRHGREPPLGYAAGLLACALANDPAVCHKMFDKGFDAPALLLSASSQLRCITLGLSLLARLCEVPGSVEKVVEKNGAKELAVLLLLAYERSSKDDHFDAQRAALHCMAIMGESEEFVDVFEEEEGLELLLAGARAQVPALRIHAGHAIAKMCAHRHVRLLLVRKHIIQFFVGMAEIESKRQDLRDCKRVAALGLANMCATYHLRLAAAVCGALPAVHKLIGDEDSEVRALAANALMNLALVEENGRRFVFAGALRPLIRMARSGALREERSSCGAMTNLAINDENVRALLAEGVITVVQYLETSADPTTAYYAVKLLKRIRESRLRSAARVARVIATKCRELQIEEAIANGEEPPPPYTGPKRHAIDTGKFLQQIKDTIEIEEGRPEHDPIRLEGMEGTLLSRQPSLGKD